MTETTLTLDTADGRMHAFRTAPNGEGRGPEHGYVALAPELFHRTGHGVELG